MSHVTLSVEAMPKCFHFMSHMIDLRLASLARPAASFSSIRSGCGDVGSTFSSDRFLTILKGKSENTWGTSSALEISPSFKGPKILKLAVEGWTRCP